MAYSTRRNNLEWTKMNKDPNCFMRQVWKQCNTPSVPAMGPSTTDDDAIRNVAADEGNRITLQLDDARRAANEHAKDNKTDDDEKRKGPEPPEYPP